MKRIALAVLVALVLPAGASAAPKVKPTDRAAINALLDDFIPSVVAGKDVKRGKALVGGYASTSVQRYPAKGSTFHGWLVNYAYPGDVGFDILLQPTDPKMGPWSFRAEAQKIKGKWKITTWYPVATYAPAGQTQTVVGPNDFGPANGSAAPGTDKARLGSWVLLTPVLGLGLLGLGAGGIAGRRWLTQRNRVRELRRALAR